MHPDTKMPNEQLPPYSATSTSVSLGTRIMQWLKHPGFQKYSRNTGWPLIIRIISLGFSFLVSTYIARYLGPQNYGELSYAVSFTSIFGFIATLGIDQVLYRDLIKFPTEHALYMGTAVRLKLIASCLTTLLSIGIAYIISPHDISLTLIYIVSFTYIFNSWNLILYEIQAHIEQKATSLISLAVIIILNVLKIYVAFYNKGVYYLAAILLIEPILYVGFYIWYREKRYESMKLWKFDSTKAKQILRDSWPVMISTSFAVIYTRIDQVMIKNLMDSASVGVYDAAVRIAEAWYFVPGIIASSLYPALVNGKKISEYVYRKRVLFLTGGLLVLGIVTSLVIQLLAPFIIQLFYGPAYVRSVLVLQIYMWSGVWISVGTVVGYYLINENQKKSLLFSSLGAMILNIILNLIYIPRYGIMGAAWATFISYIILALPILPLIFQRPSNSTSQVNDQGK